MTDAPLVSVIVPVYNGAQYLRESLDSILAQTYPRLEVLVMDDASTDETPSVIAGYGERVRHVRQPQTRGIYGNANDGMALAQGQYIAIYHADDVYHTTIVEREVAFLERYPQVGAVFCQDIFMDAVGREFGRLDLPPAVRGEQPLDFAVIFNTLLTCKNRFLRCPSSMVRASVYREVGPYRDAEYRNTSDLEMWLRIAQSYPLGILEAHLFLYRRGHGSSSERYHHLRTDPERFFQIMDEYLDKGGRAVATPLALAAYEGHRAEDQLKLAVNHYILGRLAEMQPILRTVSGRQILRGSQPQRARWLALWLGLQPLTHLPRLAPVAHLFYRRWYAALDAPQRPTRRRMRTQLTRA